MDENKFNRYMAGGLIFTALAIVIFGVSIMRPGSLGAYILHTQRGGAQIERNVDRDAIDAIYSISFAFPQREITNAALFIPEYEIIEAEAAKKYLEHFDIGELLHAGESQDGAYYTFKGTRGELSVSKRYNRIMASFHADSFGAAGDFLDAEGAKEAALAFMIAAGLPFEFKAVTADEINAGFAVSFFREVHGLLSKDHGVRVFLDGAGNILQVDYHNLKYERIAVVSLIPAREALYRLPVFEGADDIRVDLKKAALVYRFEDSILQPAFFFEGEKVAGGVTVPFTYFVNAAKFN